VKRPGNYELPMGMTFRENWCSNMPVGCDRDKPLKAFIPGGASAPFLTPEHLDVKLDFESVAAAGSMLGIRRSHGDGRRHRAWSGPHSG
jgi:NADH-quinone oxidoreductase subunit F